jgi:branched-chain amino acid transport system substrate-binding protein
MRQWAMSTWLCHWLTQVRATTWTQSPIAAQQLTAEVLAQKKDYVRAIHTLLLEGMTGSSEEQVKETRAQIRQFVAEKLDKKGLIRMRNAYPRSYPGDLASLRLIDYYIGRGEDHLAEREIGIFLPAFPAHPAAQKASESPCNSQHTLKNQSVFHRRRSPLVWKPVDVCHRCLGRCSTRGGESSRAARQPTVGLIVKGP